jgi:hypothetical protein
MIMRLVVCQYLRWRRHRREDPVSGPGKEAKRMMTVHSLVTSLALHPLLPT